jgi:predicted metal-dependent hydrolase
MATQLQLGEITVDVQKKDIRNIHLSVHPPTGRVRISAPQRMSSDTIRVYAIAKLGWIRQHQKKLIEQERESPREYINRESHYLWGKRYLLKVIARDAKASVERKHNQLVLTVRPDVTESKKQEVLEEWYRQQLRGVATRMIAKWEKLIDVKPEKCFVQRMKTRWGSCNVKSRSIRLNTELAKKPVECLEYIIVHELAHLREPTHNRRFVKLMDLFLPDWQHRRDVLNRLPVRHERWVY